MTSWHSGIVPMAGIKLLTKRKRYTVIDTVMHIYSYLFAYKYIIFTSESHTWKYDTCTINLLNNNKQ